MVGAPFGEGDFIEIFVDAPLAVTELRRPLSLCLKLRCEELLHFTGIGGLMKLYPTHIS